MVRPQRERYPHPSGGAQAADGRRLAACKLLGLHHVEVRRFGELSPAERRVIELEENLHRKDLTAH